MPDEERNQQALKYHEFPKPGKIDTGISKSCKTQEDLALAYTPGVGAVSLAIHENPENSWKYTNRSNTVAIITDGSAVLGLGDIGPEAAMPVMEGKLVLFKKFADIDGFPLCMQFKNANNTPEFIEEFINAVIPLTPSLGGINLEDIKAPNCFEIQERLDELLPIPVFHDDQHGTAIILTAGLINATKLANKEMSTIKILINGAGSAGIATAKLLLNYGVKKNNIFLCDSKGLITTSSPNLNKYKQEFAQDQGPADLAQAIKGLDVFIGVSAPNIVTEEMVKSMAENPIIFAVANPIPEIMPEKAHAAGAFIVATGRSDYPNQVNNALCFPGLFRGTFDTRSTTVNLDMMKAASQALASLTNEPLSGPALQILETAYPEEAAQGVFTATEPLTKNYIIPKQFDLRVVPRVARYVAQAAMSSGAAQIQIADLDAYETQVFQNVLKNWQQ